ncbi:MAG: hypothetical protein ACREFN_08770 [Acetobacteraceae bacterium]
MTIARHILSSYARSRWLWGEFVVVLAFYTLYDLEFPGTTTYFFGTAGEGLGALAIVASAILAGRATHARMYITLARLPSRGAYVRGMILAASALRVPLYLVLMVLALVTHRITGTITLGGMFWGSVGLLANCIILAALTVTLSPPIATRFAQMAFLFWLALTLFSTSQGDILPWLALPLAPLAACYTLTTSGFSGQALLALVGAAVYVVGLTALAQAWMARRDLLLH